MPFLFNKTKRTTLFYIIENCRSFNELEAIYACKKVDVTDLLKGTFYRGHFKKNRPFYLLSHFFDALEDASQPIMAFWMIVSFFSLGAATLLLAGLFALSSLVVLLCSFLYYQYQNKKNNAVEIKDIQLSIIKIQAINELFRRDAIHLNEGPSFLDKPDFAASKMKSILFGIVATNLLLCSFYWALTDSLVTIGMIGTASVLTGPIGFGIAAAIAITVGILLALQHYRSQKTEQIISQSKESFAKELETKQILLKNISVLKPDVYHGVKLNEKPWGLVSPPSFSLKRSMSQTFYGRQKPPKAEKQIERIKKELRCGYI